MLFSDYLVESSLNTIIKTSIVDDVLERVFQQRRLHQACEDEKCQRCYAKHRKVLTKMVENNKPITMILPAFPAKSSNRNKTLSDLPDLGEELALRSLNTLCQDINIIYQPGARVIICSDGRVFSDVVNVNDSDVSCYQDEIRQTITRCQLSHITTYSLDDYFSHQNHEQMRVFLQENFQQTQESLKHNIKNDESMKLLFNGMHRFLFEDYAENYQALSRNALRKKTKDATYQVILRSNAWSEFIKTQFPNTLRLSIHPQSCGSDKLGIQMIQSNSAWATPWHNVVVKINDQFHLMKNYLAKQMGAKLIINKNRPSHYVL